jgi:hypothetical protein
MFRFILALGLALCAVSAAAAPLTLRFDFSRGAIGVDATIGGEPAYVLLDTGVDPSVIDLGRAEALGLKLDRAGASEPSGEGDATSAPAYPTAIPGLSLGGRRFAPIEALAVDAHAISEGYGRPVDAILGYSFLNRRIVLIDYPGSRVSILERRVEAASIVRGCRMRYELPMRMLTDENFPLIPAFRFGAASGPVTFDTGSNGGPTLYQAALALPGVRAAMRETGAVSHAGVRGAASAKSYALDEAIGFGPFSLAPGQAVTVRDELGSAATRIANVGNPTYAALKLKVLLDYRARRMTFYGTCP